ncbi:MAG: hypothetical protein P8Y99_01205 [Calditrichaceae bacterium]|jgi:ABC-type multidrug transport system fused ATPase/permease subunit
MNRNKLLKRNIKKLNIRLDKCNQNSNKLSWIRLAIIISGFLITVLALFFSNELLSGIAIFIFLFVFTFASYVHKKIKLSIKRYKLWLSIKTEHLNRAILHWTDIPVKNYTLNTHHPFAVDLDIIGEKSLHRLIDNTTSKNASDRLLSWLLEQNPDPDLINRRQELVSELISLHSFRDTLSYQSKIVSEQEFDGNKFLSWLNKENKTIPGRLFFYGLISLASVNIVLFVLNSMGLIPTYYTISFTLYILLFISKIKFIGSIFWEAIDLDDEIHKVSRNFLFLERYPFLKNSLISELLNPIRKATSKPSIILRRLRILISLFGFSSNIIIKILLNIVLPVDYILAEIFLRNKEKIKKQIPEWLDCWYELEALSALANYAWLNPEYVFPEFNTDKSLLNALQLGHPLIKKETKQTNDFHLDKIGDIILITGSNMSGKSTFLRTIGINICLAQAGSAVNAKAMTLQFMRLYTCIKIDDNLAEGLSYFYAEVKRLKQMLLELKSSDEYPLFYLIDEIYKGTNNQERLAGSRALIKALSDKFGAGVVSTHDLELTGLETEMKTLQNFHFQEHIEKGKMVFDFKLRKGPCPTTNALIIMKNEGLPT